MPPTAKDKEANAALIASLPIRDQVDQLSQALLREFMHRKGFKKTLETFDSECPRTERTVSSRNIMKKLLNIPVEGRQSRLVAGKGGAPTFMEELCSYRLTKRDYAFRHKKRREQNRSSSDAAAHTNWSDDDAAEVEDPSDIELSALASQAQTREAPAAEAAEVLAEYESLVAAREKRLSKKAKKRKVWGGRRSIDTSEGPSSGDSSDSDAGATSSRLRTHSRAQTLTNALDAFAFHSEEEALAMPPNVPRANVTSDWSALSGVGSAWSPPGAATARSTASNKLEGNDPFTPFNFPGYKLQASLPDRPSFLAGDGMTLSNGREPRTSLRRDEILDTWRPGGSGTARGGGGLLGSGGRAKSSQGRPFSMPGGGGSAEPPSLHLHKSSLSSNEDSFKYSAGGPNVYDPSAQPHSSALVQNNSSSSLLSGTDHGRRQGIGFRRTSDPSAARTERRVKLLVD